MKFQKGDKIHSIKNPLIEGEILDVLPNTSEYVVAWAHHAGHHNYSFKDIDTYCEKMQSLAASWAEWMMLNSTYGMFGTPKKQHEHKWQKYIGFREKYKFCDCGEKTELTED